MTKEHCNFKGRAEQKTFLSNRMNEILFVLIIVVSGAIFFAFNYYTPLFADDYSYSFSFYSNERIRSIKDIFPSMKTHYNTMNGRLVTHFLAQLFLYLGKNIFNVINTFAYIVLGLLIYWHSGYIKRKSVNPLWLTVIYTLLYLLVPAYGQSFLWVTGSSNYLYGILIVLLFLIPYRIYMSMISNNRNIIINIVLAILNGCFGILAGATNENNSIAIICVVIALIVSTKIIYQKKIQTWMVTGLAGNIIGCILLLIAPGTSSRLENAGGTGGILTWLYRMVFITFTALEYLWPGILLLAVLCMAYLATATEKTRNEKIAESLPMFIYLLGMLTAVYSMIVSPQFPARVWSGPTVFLIIANGNMFEKIDFTSNIQARINSEIACAVLTICVLGSCCNTYFYLKNISIENNARVESILKQKNQGSTIAYVDSIAGYSKYCCFQYDGDLSENADEWPNNDIARYYGMEKIELLK